MTAYGLNPSSYSTKWYLKMTISIIQRKIWLKMLLITSGSMNLILFRWLSLLMIYLHLFWKTTLIKIWLYFQMNFLQILYLYTFNWIAYQMPTKQLKKYKKFVNNMMNYFWYLLKHNLYRYLLSCKSKNQMTN